MATLGTPEGDLRKYQVMTNREIDYDQVRVDEPGWIASHPQQFFDEYGNLIEEEPWYPPNAANPGDLANGYDTRYLMSWGPLGENVAPPGQEPITYLFPGDSLKLTLAYVCGDSFHDVNNPQTSCDYIDPTKFVYDDLVYNCSKAQFLYDHDFQILPPYAPQHFRITASTNTAIQLSWNAYSTMPGTGVNVYRKIEGGQYGANPINPTPIPDTTFQDTNFILGTRYYYHAQGVRFDTVRSYYSNEATIIAGAPLPPTGLEAESCHNGSVPLSWNPNTESDLNHYAVYRQDSSGVFTAIGTSVDTHFSDNTVTNGIEYTYAVSAVDNGGLESDLSDSVTAIPMGFNEELLVILHHRYNYVFEWSNDSLDAYYQHLFDDTGETPDFLFVLKNNPVFPSLPELSSYRTVWIIDDTHSSVTGSSSFLEARAQVLSTYLILGGNVVFSGRHLVVGSFGGVSGMQRNDNSLLRNYFAIDSIRADNCPPFTYPVCFASASPAISGYPSVEVDSAKIALLLPASNYTLEVDGMVPVSLGETFYTYVSSYPDSSEFQGMATGVRYDSTTVMLTFPLYAMEPYDSVMTLAENILRYVRGEHFQGITDRQGELPIPKEYSLYQNYPNPFNSTTVMSFDLPMASQATIVVYNILGQRVKVLLDAQLGTGTHRIQFDASTLAAGVYFYEFRSGNFTAVKKMVLLK
jgi:hypothetical protein